MIKIFYRFSTRVVTTDLDSLKLFRKFYSWKPNKIYAFYNSQFDKIITQQHLMLMPIDERLATRAHAATQIVPIKNQRIMNISAHTKLLFQRANFLAIKPCLKEDMLLSKIVDTVKAAFNSYLHQNTKEDLQNESFDLRIVFSSGHGDFGIAARDNACIFYAIVSESKQDFKEIGVKQYTTKQLNVNIQDYNPSKTGNEIQHSIMQNEAKKKGGFSGIKYTKDKIILEASAGNLGFVFENSQQLVIPRRQKVQINQTLKQAIEFLQNSQGSHKTKVVQKDVTIQQSYSAREIILFGKDKIIPVLSLDDHTISDGRGSLTQKLQNWYEQCVQEGVIVEI